MSQRVCYIVSNIDKALAFEWIAKSIDKEKIDLRFLLVNPKDSVLEQFLVKENISVKRITYRSKKDLPFAIIKIFWYLISNSIKVVHCHLFDACIAGMTAAWLAMTPKRIYTRHYSTNHHVYYPSAVKYDKYINALATDIIAISENVKKVLIELENVKTSKIHVIHHGFDLKDFTQVNEDLKSKMHLKYIKKERFPVIGVISRYVELKGLQYVIPAFIEIKKKYPDAFLLLANCNGDYKPVVQSLLKNGLSEDDYCEISFENDLPTLYSLMDVFVHVPIDETIEAFGQTYIEALAANIPSVFTLSGVAGEFIVNEQNALVVDYKNTEQIYTAIDRVLTDQELRKNLILNGQKSIVEKFSLQLYINKLTSLYE